jgi:signal peptidase I
MKLLHELYAIALYAYPSDFRARFGREMQQVFRARCERTPSLTRFLLATARDILLTSIQERFSAMTFTKLGYTAGVLALFLTLTATGVRAYFIPTTSMEPSLRIGDHLLVTKLIHEPQRGELIIFPFPGDPTQTFVKRIIGLPGDRISIQNKTVIRNGAPLIESYAEHRDNIIQPQRDNFQEVVVPDGSYFVLGDNRDRSLDSRFWGFVPKASVLGRPWLVYWSYDPLANQTRWDRTFLELH